jgi:hypothetical protein
LIIGPNGATITLQAVGGPVSWSIGEAGLLGTVTISPSSGSLAAGQQVSVTVTASLLAAGDVLSVSPCGHTYLVVVGSGALVSASSLSATSDAPPLAAAGVQPPTSGVSSAMDSVLLAVVRKAKSP